MSEITFNSSVQQVHASQTPSDQDVVLLIKVVTIGLISLACYKVFYQSSISRPVFGGENRSVIWRNWCVGLPFAVASGVCLGFVGKRCMAPTNLARVLQLTLGCFIFCY